jgi:hypothetical protein
MTDVYIVTLLILGTWITGPGLAATINFLLPGVVEVAACRIALTPIKSLIVGGFVGGFQLILALVLFQASGPLQAFGAVIAAVLLGIYSVGVAAMSRMLGERIGGTPTDQPRLGNVIRGAVIYELACFVPLVGWMIFLPLAGFTAIGAALFGLVKWAPRQRTLATPMVDPSIAMQSTD